MVAFKVYTYVCNMMKETWQTCKNSLSQDIEPKYQYDTTVYNNLHNNNYIETAKGLFTLFCAYISTCNCFLVHKLFLILL